MYTNKSNFIFRISLTTLGLIFSFQASAEHWIRIASSESSFYYADKDNLTTANGAYFLIIKRSSKDENNKRSQLFKYKIDCAQGTYSLEDVKTFSEPDLKGDEIYAKKEGLNEAKTPIPNSVADKYVRVVCDDLKSVAKEVTAEKGKKVTAAPGATTPSSDAAQNSSKRSQTLAPAPAPAPAPKPQPSQTVSGNSNQKFSSKSFMIVFACEDSNGSGIDIGLSQTLMSTLQNNSSAFSSVMTTSTYMKYCKPYSLNMTNLELLKNGTLYGQSDGKEYILIKQGPTATFGVIGR